MHTELLDQLSAESRLAKIMANLLDQERDALANSDAAKIHQISAEKRSLVAELEACAKKRLQQVTNMGYRRKLGSVRHFLSQCDPSQTLLQSWDSLNRQLQLCADKNLVNGRIISLSQRRTEMALSVLRGQLNQNSTAYTRTGKVTHQPYGSSVTSA